MERLKPNVLVLKADGINCDLETSEGFRLAGGNPEVVMVDQLKNTERSLRDYQILAIPGGFSYGDDIAAGKILALELNAYLGDQINEFVQRQKGLVLGICNGFQVLTTAGLLPFGTIGEMQATLEMNNVRPFDCRPIKLRVEDENACLFLKEMNGTMEYRVAHGEGRFYAAPEAIDRIEEQQLVVFRYCDVDGNPTQEYPLNPNGSLNAIAGICDPYGRILGLMPHPERSIKKTQYDNWRRMENFKPEGLQIFEGMVKYASQM